MEKWINLPINIEVMFFYNNRAEMCEGRDCLPIPQRNAKNVGLATK
jgi:hypothetical protein